MSGSRPAGAGAHRSLGGDAARDLADAVLQRAARLRHAPALPRARRGPARDVLPRSRRDLPRRGVAPQPALGAHGGLLDPGARRARAHALGLGADRDVTDGDVGPFPDRARLCHRPARAGDGDQIRTERSPSTTRATSAPATRPSSATPTRPSEGSSSMGGSPRTSSSPPGRGSTSGSLERSSSPPPRRSCRTRSSPASIATPSASSSS